MNEKEIGGYLELECYGARLYHKDALAFNTGRNALRYLIRAHRVKKIFAPYYTCPVVWDALSEEGCEIAFYDIDRRFMPAADIPKSAFVLVNDWFGVCGNTIAVLARKYTNLLVDNAQSFYALPKGIGSFYSPRKFFGLPDGGLLLSDKKLLGELEKDVSYERAAHLLKRYDLDAGDAYYDFKRNDQVLSDRPVLGMSNLTLALMGNIDYERVRYTRLENFRCLHGELAAVNELAFDLDVIVCPMAYPFLIKKRGLRERLISERIYVAQYWDFSGHNLPENTFSTYLSAYLLPLPIDQRYKTEDMRRIIKIIKEYLGE